MKMVTKTPLLQVILKREVPSKAHQSRAPLVKAHLPAIQIHQGTMQKFNMPRFTEQFLSSGWLEEDLGLFFQSHVRCSGCEKSNTVLLFKYLSM